MMHGTGRAKGRWNTLRVLLSASCASCATSTQVASDPAPQLGTVGDQVQPSLAAAQDAEGRLWIVAGYTDLSDPQGRSVMGLSIRSPNGAWQTFPPLRSPDGDVQPSGDAWLAAPQHGARTYYVSLNNDFDTDDPPNGVGEGVALAIVDVSSGAPVITPPRRIDLDVWDGWDEPTVSATRPPHARDDTVIVAATPIAPDMQDTIAVLVSNDNGAHFAYTAIVHAPGYVYPIEGPENTVVRPYLQQDPRPGFECHASLAFGVRYATALRGDNGVQSPPCANTPEGCRSIAETETRDCGRTWSDPRFIVVDTGPPSAPDYRGFSYARASDGSRAVVYCRHDPDGDRMIVKRAAAGERFDVRAIVGGEPTWLDGSLEVVTGPIDGARGLRLSRPTLAASDVFAAFWVQEDPTIGASSVRWASSRPTAIGVWTTPQSVDSRTDGPGCDALPMPFDNYLGATPLAPFGDTTTSFLLAWTGFAPCGSVGSHHIMLGEVP